MLIGSDEPGLFARVYLYVYVLPDGLTLVVSVELSEVPAAGTASRTEETITSSIANAEHLRAMRKLTDRFSRTPLIVFLL
jgi:hypothetical protein